MLRIVKPHKLLYTQQTPHKRGFYTTTYKTIIKNHMRKYSAYFKKLRTMSRSNYSVNDITAITCELYIVACIFYAFLFHPKT